MNDEFLWVEKYRPKTIEECILPENIKKTIAPKPGRLVLFNGDYVHTGHSPSEHQTRILLNIVLS